MSFLTSRVLSTSRTTVLGQTCRTSLASSQRYFSMRSPTMAANLTSENISKVTEAEKRITGQDEPVRRGPTVQAQSHAGEPINSTTLHDITEGEKKITGGERVKGGPTSAAQSILSKSNNANQSNQSTPITTNNQAHSGNLDSATISKITAAEKDITGSDGPVRGGPTAQAQRHANQPITSEALHDITEGEKKIAGGERVNGGPTSAAQSELGRSRS